MEFWLNFLPLIIYILIIVALVVVIVLGIKAIITMDKVDKIVNSVSDKVESLNTVFNLIDFASDKFTFMVEKVVDFFSDIIQKIWYKKSIKEEEEDE